MGQKRQLDTDAATDPNAPKASKSDVPAIQRLLEHRGNVGSKLKTDLITDYNDNLTTIDMQKREIEELKTRLQQSERTGDALGKAFADSMGPFLARFAPGAAQDQQSFETSMKDPAMRPFLNTFGSGLVQASQNALRIHDARVAMSPQDAELEAQKRRYQALRSGSYSFSPSVTPPTDHWKPAPPVQTHSFAPPPAHGHMTPSTMAPPQQVVMASGSRQHQSAPAVDPNSGVMDDEFMKMYNSASTTGIDKQFEDRFRSTSDRDMY